MGSTLPPRKQAFLDMLAARASGRETAPADPPPAAEEGTDPAGGAPEPVATDAPPLTFEEQPPAAEEVPPALAAIGAPATETWEDRPASSPELMDLGADAQAQGTAMALATIANRLAGIIRDLGTLEYLDKATELVPAMEWAVEEHNRINHELEQRGQERRGETNE